VAKTVSNRQWRPEGDSWIPGSGKKPWCTTGRYWALSAWNPGLTDPKKLLAGAIWVSRHCPQATRNKTYKIKRRRSWKRSKTMEFTSLTIIFSPSQSCAWPFAWVNYAFLLEILSSCQKTQVFDPWTIAVPDKTIVGCRKWIPELKLEERERPARSPRHLAHEIPSRVHCAQAAIWEISIWYEIPLLFHIKPTPSKNSKIFCTAAFHDDMSITSVLFKFTYLWIQNWISERAR